MNYGKKIVVLTLAEDYESLRNEINKSLDEVKEVALENFKHQIAENYFGQSTSVVESQLKEDEALSERDEGKPGKNFAKIADKAAKEYGSKAAGERVAGAIRAKLAKKHPSEYHE